MAARADTTAPAPGRSFDGPLLDRTPVVIRPLVAEDRAQLRAFFEGLLPGTIRLRYLAQHRVRPEELAELTSGDGVSRLHVAAWTDGRIVGIAEYRKSGPACAEVSFLIGDAFQGEGLGSLFLRCLAAAALEAGIRCFHADTLERNERMLAVFRHSGLRVQVSAPQAGEVAVILALAAGPGPHG